MSDMQRYATSENYDTSETCMVRQADGQWIKNSDHIKAIESKDKTIANQAGELEKIQWNESKLELEISNQKREIKQLNDTLREYKAQCAEQAGEIEESKDFVIWLTGADYDFTQHPYYLKKMKELIK